MNLRKFSLDLKSPSREKNIPEVVDSSLKKRNISESSLEDSETKRVEMN